MTADWFGGQLEAIHGLLRAHFPGVERVAVALYDPQTDKLKTFVHSTEGESPLVHYEARLAEVPSLADLARSGRSRVIDDLLAVRGSSREHARRLLEAGYQSSYTMPVREGGRLFGFLFFDSKLPHYFTPWAVERLAVFGHLLAVILVQSVTPARMLHSALRVASRLTHYRDPETGAHLDRMSRYARLIARSLAPQYGLSDEFVEFLFLFAPAHDVGKIAVPDRILLKQGPLLEEEFETMKTHVTKGAEIVDGIVRDLGLGAFPHIEVLRNVVLFHHEAIDGSGYPEGRAGSQIPVEARMVTVADVFDALTSERPYKAAWSREAALGYLRERMGTKFDAACVSVLLTHTREVEEIGLQFRDDEGSGHQSRAGYTLDL
ncbi:MAG TPA: HD domain-containing phosphohydrolase [Vicinamibacteria bacterium]